MVVAVVVGRMLVMLLFLVMMLMMGVKFLPFNAHFLFVDSFGEFSFG